MDAAHKQHRTRTLWLMGILHAFTHFFGVILLPLYLRIQVNLKLASVERATLLMTVYGMSYFLPSYFLGALADRISRKRLLATGLAISSLGFVGLSFAPNYPMALVCMVVAGFGGSFYHPAATALIARLFPEARGRALGLVAIGASVGFSLGPIYSGWRAVHSGSWRSPVLESGVMGLIASGLFVWLADEERSVESPGIETKSSAPTKLFPTTSLWVFFVATAVLFSLRDFVGNGMATSGSLFLQNARGFSPGTTGLALSGIFIASVVSNPLFGQLSDRNRIGWITVILIIAAILIAIFPRVSPGWMIPVLLAYGFFFLASYPISEAALMESVPDEVRGRVFGLFITLSGLLANISHWLVGDWVERLGARASSAASYYPLYTGLAVLVVASLGALPFLHGLRKREHMDAPGVVPVSALQVPD